MTASLVALLVVVIGGGYFAYRWTQDQYYVGANSEGQVLIYRGVDQQILGVSLSGLTSRQGSSSPRYPRPTSRR